MSVCSYSDGKLEVLATYPVDQTSRVNDDLLTVSPVMRKSLASGQAVSLRDLVTSVPPDQLAREPVAIAAPILESQGEVRGFILAEKIGFFQFTPAALTTTSTIARWTSHSLQAAHLYHETKDRNIEDDLTGAYGSQYMLTRLQEEISRAEKFHFPLSVAVLDINRHSDLLPDSMPTVLAVLGDVFRHKLGSADLVGRHPDGVSLVIACRPSAIMGHI